MEFESRTGDLPQMIFSIPSCLTLPFYNLEGTPISFRHALSYFDVDSKLQPLAFAFLSLVVEHHHSIPSLKNTVSQPLLRIRFLRQRDSVHENGRCRPRCDNGAEISLIVPFEVGTFGKGAFEAGVPESDVKGEFGDTCVKAIGPD